MYKSMSICAMLATALLLLSSGCDKKVVMTDGLPSIIGTVVADSGSSGVTTQAQVSVDGTRLIPVVAISSDTLELAGYNSSGEYMWTSEWQGANLHLVPGDSCKLHVYQSNGEATTDEMVIPHMPIVTAPDTGFVLKQHQSLTVNWVATEGVDRYNVEFYLHYYYKHGTYFSMDTTIVAPAGTSSYTLPDTVVFPSYVDSVSYGSCRITITAETGPNIGFESNGNIKGKGCGYFFTTASAESQCSIGSHYSEVESRPRPEHRARLLLARKQALIAVIK